MFNKELFFSSYETYNKCVIYACGCDAFVSDKKRYTDKNAFPLGNRICFGWIFEHNEAYTLRTLKAVKLGLAGDEWKNLLETYPNGTVDFCFELYKCPNCDYWINEENLSFYLPKPDCKPKVKSILYDEYQLYKEYVHICPQCNSVLDKINEPGQYSVEESYEKYAAIRNESYQTVKDLHLKCRDCNSEITLLERGDWSSRGQCYTIFGKKRCKPRLYTEWLKLLAEKAHKE